LQEGVQEEYLHLFFTSAPDGDQCSASRLNRFKPEKEHTYPLNRRLIGPCS